jgi:hypothetical protein
MKVIPYLPIAVQTMATGAANPASVDIQPAKKPVAGLYSLVRKLTSPPFSGNRVAKVAYTNAPQIAMIPPTTHNSSIENV